MNYIDVKEEVHKFADRLRLSEVYQEYQAAREEIRRNPELYQQVNEFRQRNFDLQKNTNEEQLMEAMDAFANEYEEFRANPVVDRFLSAELAFCRMMQDISVQVTEELDFE